VPIPHSIPGSDTANHVFSELRCDLVSDRDVSAWAAELRDEGFTELADAIDAQLRREKNGERAELRPWPNATTRSRSSIKPAS
jgi:hypothetical protein